MNATVIFPSPNWFQVSGVAISIDGWLIYGGPSKSLCVLEPLNASHGSGTGDYYHAHVVNRAHAERIVSVDISQEWPDKKLFLTASADGSVKQWSLECVQNVTKIKSTHWLDTHQNVREEVTGVGYSSEPFAITVGTYGNVVKWDLNSNVAKTYHKFLKKFRPTCMSCSHHVPLTVAVGTKQGVVFVLDLNGPGNVVYKVRGQDDEIVNVSWCPQYEVLIRKSLKKYVRKSSAMKRLEKIRSEVDDENINDSVATELSTRASEVDEEDFNDCGATKSLPDDSFDESIVQEDDTFDIYKDHEADEFGHKKFVPKDIIVRVKEEKETDDFLAECLKLKNDILKMKDESDDDNDNETVDSLAEALDKTHVDSEPETSDLTSLDKKETISETNNGFSSHVQRHVLATIGKYGGIRLWSKTGKLIGSCVVANTVNKKFKNPHYTTLIWYKPNILLIADGKSHLLQCNPLMIDCKKKLNWRVVHSLHKRGLYCVATNAPRVQAADRSSDQSADRSSDQCAERSSDQSPDQWRVWTVGQDRSLICYSMERRAMIGSYNTSGSSIFTIHSCPYDAKSVAISVGDGAVRVWETDILEEDETKLSMGHVTAYWQNVQGKVLTVAWHPTRENLIAFATGESRVGLIEASGKGERAARTLAPALRGAVYALCWGDGYDLYASGGGRLVMFRTNKPDEDPVVINVEFEGQKWEVCSVNWYPRGMLCGSIGGAVAVLDPHSREVLTVAFVFGKMIHSMEWHPEQTSSSSAESPFKDLIAVSSLDKCNSIAILEYADKGDGPKLHKLKSLTGHTSVVLQLAWNPHKEAQLLSTSHDCTVRVWDVPTGECYAIYGGHVQSSLGAAWCALPQLPSTVLSGGADCCLRVWRAEDHPAKAYKEISHDVPKKDKKQRAKTYENTEQESAVEAPHAEAPHVEAPHAVQVATTAETKFKASKRFLLPNIRQQMWQFDAHGLRRMAKKLFKSEESGENNQEIKFEKVYQNVDDLKSEEIEKSGDLKNDKTNGDHDNDEIEIEDESTNGRVETDEIKENEHMYIDFLKIFGSTNELNELLDLQMHRHLEHARFEAWSMLSIFRGHIDATVQAASQRDALCPFLVSIAPCVSFKYWKDVTQLYLAQIERLVARGEEEKVGESPLYGGSVYRRAALLLSLHDPKGAAAALVDARLFPEAYVLAKSRHLDGVAQDVLRTWGDDCVYAGRADLGAMCYLALGELDKAAVTLAKSHDEKLLGVAAELAKAAGQPTFAAHIEDKKSLATTKDAPGNDSDEDLKELPTRIDLLKASIGMGDGGEN